MSSQVVARSSKVLDKPNPEIGWRIKNGKMTLFARKIYNSLVWRAQNMKMQGKGVLPFPVGWDMAAEGIRQDIYWWLPVSDLIDDCNPNGTGEARRLKNYISDLMTVTIERQVAGWEIDHIIGKVRIINTLGPDLAQRGGKMMLGWYFPPELEDKILKPDEFTRMSLYYQGQLKTEASLVLYEICKRYSTNPSQVTDKMPWRDWHQRMTSPSDDAAAAIEYKVFRRYSLKTAISEVNAITDLKITLIEHKIPGTKAVEKLQFLVEIKEQSNLELSELPVIKTRLLDDMEALGVSPIIAEKLYIEHGEVAIKKALDHTARAINITNPAGYFRKALTDNYAAGAEKAASEKAKKTADTTKRVESSTKQSVESVSSKTPFPAGVELADAWREFQMSPSAKLFKNLPDTFDADQLPPRAVKAFEGWLSSQ